MLNHIKSPSGTPVPAVGDANGNQYVNVATLLNGEVPGKGLTVFGPTQYIDCPASATTPLQNTNGAVGDLVAGFRFEVTTTLVAAVTLQDGSGTAINILANGTAPGIYWVTIPGGPWASVLGAWKIVTPANVTVRATGWFS